MVVLITKKTVGFISSIDCAEGDLLFPDLQRGLCPASDQDFLQETNIKCFFLGLVYHSISKIPKNVFVLISFFSATYVSVCSNKTNKNWKGNSTLGWCHRQFCHPVRPETPSSETSIVGDILWHLRNLSQVWPGPNTFMHCISPNWLKMENIHPYLDRNRSRSLC